jgi:hypothetical protein
MKSPNRPRPTLLAALRRAESLVDEQWVNGNIPVLAEALLAARDSRLSYAEVVAVLEAHAQARMVPQAAASAPADWAVLRWDDAPPQPGFWERW